VCELSDGCVTAGKILLNQSDYLIGAEQIDVSFLVSPRSLFGSVVGNVLGERVRCRSVSHSSVQASVELLKSPQSVETRSEPGKRNTQRHGVCPCSVVPASPSPCSQENLGYFTLKGLWVVVCNNMQSAPTTQA